MDEIAKTLHEIKIYALIGAKNVLTVDEACIMTGLSKGRLYLLTSTKQIPFYKPRGKVIYFKKDELESWMLRNRTATDDELQINARSAIILNRI